MPQLSKKYLITQADIDLWKSLKHIPSNKWYEAELYALIDLYIKFVNEKQSRCLNCVDDWRKVKDDVAMFFGVHQEWAEQKIKEVEGFTNETNTLSESIQPIEVEKVKKKGGKNGKAI